MPATEFTIGHLARKTGCKVPTIRYYEKIGLLPEPRRSAGNTRLYGAEHIARLGFIRHCRELGFPQPAVRDLLELTEHPEQTCEAVTRIANTHLADVKRRIDRLEALKVELERMIKNCGARQIRNCYIVEALASHSHSHC
ncbi:MAG: helix-turn-helix domain-containing protein [Gammaproteobacteria bacterium]